MCNHYTHPGRGETALRRPGHRLAAEMAADYYALAEDLSVQAYLPALKLMRRWMAAPGRRAGG